MVVTLPHLLELFTDSRTLEVIASVQSSKVVLQFCPCLVVRLHGVKHSSSLTFIHVASMCVHVTFKVCQLGHIGLGKFALSWCIWQGTGLGLDPSPYSESVRQ